VNEGQKNNPIAEQEIARSGWISGNLAQLTVLLTGLALAGAAYAILNILIDQMVSEHHQRLIQDTRQSVIEKLVGLEKAISVAAAVTDLSSDQTGDKLRERVTDIVPDLSNFDRVFFARPAQNKEWETVNIVSQEAGNFSQTTLKSLVHSVLAHREEGSDAVIVIASPPGMEYWQEDAEPVIKGQPFVIAQPVALDGGETGLIIGIARVSRVLHREWLEQRLSVSRLVISDTESKQRVYYMNQDLTADENADFGKSGTNAQFGIGGSRWALNLLPGKDRQTSFLEQTPWLMLAFGITLTLLGTLYVRNNQRQSYKLGIMNRELARKNYELNSEVAERERLNQNLRKAEREYRAIIDSVSDIIFETTVAGEIVFLNDTWQKITGFDIEQVKGRNLFDLLHPQDQEEQRSSFEMLVKGKKGAYRTFTRLRTSEGTFRSVELAMSMLRQDENRHMHVVGTVTDVEERRRAEKALSEAEKKYRTIVENAAGGIYQVTPEGQFLSANPAMARILGYDTTEQMLREVRNAHDNLYVSVRDRTTFIRELETTGTVHNFETEVRTKSGNKIWVNENARAVKDDDGNILYYEGSMENVTSRKHTEIDLREAKIQSDLANRAKSEFLTNMSHELRTPLNAIIGFAEVIRNEVLGPIGNKQYWEYAKDIHDSGERLLTVINEILDVSSIESGERQINESEVNADDLVKLCVGFMLQKAEAGGLKISNMTAGKIPNVIGEELAMKQILINLIGNSIKYTPEGGRITLSHEIENSGRLRLSVTDTGIGMEEHEIEKALSPFGQLETSHNRAGSGAGLGLTLVESLMKLHGGELEIFSQKGIGTTVTIIFPARLVVAEVPAEGPYDDDEEERRRAADRREAERRQNERRTREAEGIFDEGDEEGTGPRQVH